jgi:hypothetical protein
MTRCLTEHFNVIAPDLLGHAESAEPPGDASPGARGIRDLLMAHRHELRSRGQAW